MVKSRFPYGFHFAPSPGFRQAFRLPLPGALGGPWLPASLSWAAQQQPFFHRQTKENYFETMELGISSMLIEELWNSPN